MQNKILNEYDDTKRMLNKLRTLNESKKSFKINEQFETQSSEEPQNNDIMVINDVDVKLLSSDQMDMKLSDEQKNMLSSVIDSFRDQVSQISEFEPGLTLSEKQIRLDGSIPDEDINFVLIAGEESGLYINADMLKLEQETINVLTKLFRFEQPFKDAVEPILRQRFNN
jgi:hypothetical protein